MAHLSKYERPNNERAVIWTLNFLAIELNFLLSLCFFGGKVGRGVEKQPLSPSK